MDEINPFVTKLTVPAKLGTFFFVLGALADAYAIVTVLSARHASGMGGLGAAGVAMVCVPIAVVSFVVGALIASGASHRWRGVGERRVAFICLIGIFGGTLAVALSST